MMVLCFIAVHLVVAIGAQQGCIAWRNTGGCNPDGVREAAHDLGCGEIVPTGSSGFCECAGGVRVRKSTCEHQPFICSNECAKANDATIAAMVSPAGGASPQAQLPADPTPPTQEYTCIGWRQTHGCGWGEPLRVYDMPRRMQRRPVRMHRALRRRRYTERRALLRGRFSELSSAWISWPQRP